MARRHTDDARSGADDQWDEHARNETPTERLDRNWADLLQELRVTQTGVQFLTGFLLTLPFQQRFGDLTTLQRSVYLGLVVLAGLVIALVLTPIAIHRRLSGEHVKGRLVESGHWAMQAVLASLALLVVGTTGFVFDVVVGGTGALVAGAGLGVVLVLLLVVTPRRLA